MLRVKLFQLGKNLCQICLLLHLCAGQWNIGQASRIINVALHGPLGDFVGNVNFVPWIEKREHWHLIHFEYKFTGDVLGMSVLQLHCIYIDD